MGVWQAFLVCLGVCVAWLWLFDWHFKGKMPHNQQKSEDERQKKKQRSSVRVTRRKDGEGEDIETSFLRYRYPIVNKK